MAGAAPGAHTGAAGAPTRVRYWVIVFAVTLAVVTYIDRVSMSRATPSIMQELGLDSVRMGWALSAFGWAYALFEIPGGFLGDWIGPRRVLIRIVLWWSFFTAATGWAWSAISLATTRFLFGMGEAGCFPNLTKVFTIWLPERERVRAQSIMWLSARWGGAFTPPLVGAVMRWVGWRHAFEIFGCLGVVWALFFFLWYRDDPLKNPKLNAAERQLLQEGSGRAAGHANVPWGRLIGSRQVWMLCWQYFSQSYGWYFYITWLPTYLSQGRHLQMISTELLSVLPLFMGGLGNPAAVLLLRFFSRRNGDVARTRRQVAYVAFTGASAFLMLSTRMHSPLAAVLAIGMASFCNDLAMPGSWASVMDVGGRFAGTVGGAMNMWGNVGGAICPMAVGYILRWTHYNWNVTFYASAAVYLTGVLFWALLDPVTPLERQAES